MEIDKALKKVAEGVEEFESILDKLNSTTNATQREKFEAELKKEIKKLQRSRDQIKTWLGASEIKDKRQLVDNRKLIETQMERFKAIEKELKTKAFSKEGLGLPSKVDPEEEKKQRAVDWINDTVSALNQQIDGMEAQKEHLQAGKKQKKGNDMERLAYQIERHQQHVRKLEVALRMLENEVLCSDQIDDVRPFVEDYIDTHQDLDKDQDTLDMYLCLGLEEEEEIFFSIPNEEKEEEEGEIMPRASSVSSATSVHSQKKTSSPSVKKKEPPSPPAKSTPWSQKIKEQFNEKKLDISSGSVTPVNQELPFSPKRQEKNRSQSPEKSKFPTSLADLVNVFQQAKIRAFPKNEQPESYGALELLESTLQFSPESCDMERPRPYVPQNPTVVPAYYPQHVQPVFENPQLYERLDLDTLFFIFYFQQGTHQQQLAAKQLKKMSWRFHKKYLTWFQRHEEPTEVTREYEQGTYVYFDYEGAWCQRKKSDFKFEYQFLEDSEV